MKKSWWNSPKVVLSQGTFVYFFEDLGLWSGILLKVEENLEQGKNDNDNNNDNDDNNDNNNDRNNNSDNNDFNKNDKIGGKPWAGQE